MRWEVQIVGDALDLQVLGRSFNSAEAEIVDTPRGWMVRSQHFDDLQDYGAVRARASELLAAISGASKLILGSESSLKSGSVIEHRQDGTTNTVLSVDSARIRIRGGPVSLIVKRGDGTEEVRHPADPAPAWVKLALGNQTVARALRLRAGPQEWVDLYRLLEVIESDVPVDEIIRRRWTSKTDLQRFKRTANSQKAVGDAARHGRDPHPAPAEPMPITEARSLLDGLLRRWLDWRAAGAT